MRFSIALLSLLVSSSIAASLQKRAAVHDCLDQASVPTDNSGSSTWNADIRPFNSRLFYTPAAVAVPTTIAQIQASVNCGRTSGVKVTAKSGGHSYASLGLGGRNGHLVIVLDRMFNVTLNKTTNMATVQPGARLGHVASELFKQGNRAISAGTCPGVGVSGHALHGGYGMSSHKYGLATDWIVGMTTILANGTIVQCNATSNADLFWGLRGGGSNLGIVASYLFNTFEARNITVFNIPIRGWNTTTAPKHLATLVWRPSWMATRTIISIAEVWLEDYTKTTMPADLTMRMFASSYQTNFEGLYFGDVAGLRAALKPLVDQTGLTIQTATTKTWLDGFAHYANAATDPTTPYSMQETFYAKSLMLKGLNGTSAKSFVDYWYNVGPINRRNWWFQLDFHGGAYSGVANGDFSTSSYAHRDKLYLIQFYDSIFGGSFPSNGFSFLDNFVSNVTASLPSSDWGMYINYADSRLDQTTAGRVYYGKNLERLQRLKAVYDPKELFSNPQSVRPVAT